VPPSSCASLEGLDVPIAIQQHSVLMWTYIMIISVLPHCGSHQPAMLLSTTNSPRHDLITVKSLILVNGCRVIIHVHRKLNDRSVHFVDFNPISLTWQEVTV
jgi:hypothetical protein